MQFPPARINILGVGISTINLSQAVKQIAAWIESNSHRYLNVCTVHTVMECFRNKDLRKIVNENGLATPDGMPLVWLCHFHGYSEVTRVYGPDLVLAFCDYSIRKGYRHYFYGGSDGAAQELKKNLERRYPGLNVVGTYSPPFRPVGTMEEQPVIEAINALRPDVVWVGLGTPKQDFWVAQHRPLLSAPVLVAVGAAFDFHTGRVPQAPVWMQRHGLEWLFRFMQEPRRLWKRYLVNNPLFVYLITLQLIGLKKYKL